MLGAACSLLAATQSLAMMRVPRRSYAIEPRQASAERLVAPLRMSSVLMEESVEFDDFERECFGDEDGCDLAYYGETEEDIERRLEEKERPADSVPMEDILEAGRASVARRQQIAAEMEAMREALQRAIAKDEP